jgi:hypothetical protein
MSSYKGKPDSYNSYAAGNKIYGLGRSNPTMGPVDRTGYLERDATVRLRRNALLKRMQAGNSKNYMSADWLGGKHA